MICEETLIINANSSINKKFTKKSKSGKNTLSVNVFGRGFGSVLSGLSTFLSHISLNLSRSLTEIGLRLTPVQIKREDPL